MILDGSPVLRQKLAQLNTQEIKSELNKACFMQTVKSRDQTKQVHSIMKHDFIRITKLEASLCDLVQGHLTLNPKYEEIYAVKNCVKLIEEAATFKNQWIKIKDYFKSLKWGLYLLIRFIFARVRNHHAVVSNLLLCTQK